VKKTTQIYSIIGISLVLFLLGTIGWMAINGRSLSRMFKENVEIDVILNDQTQETKAKELESILQKQSFVKNATIITKEEALQKYIEDKKEDPTQFLGYNPLYISIRTTLHSEYVNPDSIVKVKAFISQSNIVREVYYQDTIVNSLDKTLNRIGLILGALAILLFFAVIIIIDNTVRLSMFSNRMLIKTMQMVGATRGFIAKPFTGQAFITGLISGVLAILGLFGIRYFVHSIFPETSILENSLLFYILLTLILIIGILIAVFSTYRSVIKYLKLKLDDLY
jgi:cell division transport system permease protein